MKLFKPFEEDESTYDRGKYIYDIFEPFPPPTGTLPWYKGAINNEF